MNKRILSLTLALVMILGTFTAVFAEVTTVEQKAAEFLRDNGVLEGDEKGDLLLDKKLERRDAVVLSARLLGEEEKAANTKFDEKTPSWTDVRTDKFYVPFFAWAETTGRFEGKGEGIFEPRAGLTTQEYATVLLRILGHELNGKDAWKTVMELAKKEGLLENVDAKADDILMRGNMAVMTLNALGATVKGTGNTLADELNIKLPVPAKLEVEDVYADNLKQVKVKLNKAVNVENVQDKDLYSVKGLEVERVTLDNETIVIEVKEAMKENREYELSIKGLEDGNNTLDHKAKFKAYDNEAPFVVEVIGLGTKAFKVVMSEPVKNATARDFKLDGKSLSGKVDVTGNEIFVRVYSDMKVGDHTLTVGQLVDYNNFKSVSADYDFEVVEDKDAPKVVEAVAKTKKVVVTFDEDVDVNTVNARSIYWKSGSNKRYASDYTMLSGNKVEFLFETHELPLHEIDLFIDGVKDYSGNTMKEEKIAVKAEIDTVRPEVKSVEVVEGSKRNLKVTFSKPVNMKNTTDAGSALNADNYYVKDNKDNKIKAFKVTQDGNKKDTVKVELRESLSEDKTYTVVISGVVDTNTYANMMFTHESELNVKDDTKPSFRGFTHKPNTDSSYNEYVLYFSKEMDVATISDAENYIVKTSKGVRVLSEIDNSIEISRDAKKAIVTIHKDDMKDFTIEQFGVLGVKDLKGNKLSNYGELRGQNDSLTEKIKANDEANVTQKEKVVIKFNNEIDYVNSSKISVNNGLTISDRSFNGKELTLTIDGLTATKLENVSAQDENKQIIVTLEEGAIDGTNGTKNDVNKVTLVDKIQPELKSAELKRAEDGKMTLDIMFTRNIKSDNILNALEITGKDIVVEDTEVKATGTDKVTVNLKEVAKGEDIKTVSAKIKVLSFENIQANTTEKVLLSNKVLEINSNEVDVPALTTAEKEEILKNDKAAVAAVKAKFTEVDYADEDAIKEVAKDSGVAVSVKVTKEATEEAQGEATVTLTKGAANDTVDVKLAKLGA